MIPSPTSGSCGVDCSSNPPRSAAVKTILVNTPATPARRIKQSGSKESKDTPAGTPTGFHHFASFLLSPIVDLHSFKPIEAQPDFFRKDITRRKLPQEPSKRVKTSSSPSLFEQNITRAQDERSDKRLGGLSDLYDDYLDSFFSQKTGLTPPTSEIPPTFPRMNLDMESMQGKTASGPAYFEEELWGKPAKRKKDQKGKKTVIRPEIAGNEKNATLPSTGDKKELRRLTKHDDHTGGRQKTKPERAGRKVLEEQSCCNIGNISSLIGRNVSDSSFKTKKTEEKTSELCAGVSYGRTTYSSREKSSDAAIQSRDEKQRAHSNNTEVCGIRSLLTISDPTRTNTLFASTADGNLRLGDTPRLVAESDMHNEQGRDLCFWLEGNEKVLLNNNQCCEMQDRGRTIDGAIAEQNDESDDSSFSDQSPSNKSRRSVKPVPQCVKPSPSIKRSLALDLLCKSESLHTTDGRSEQLSLVDTATPTITSTLFDSTSFTSDKRRCTCKKSKCLKLYCDCFSASMFCKPLLCGCIECRNLEEHSEEREGAIKDILSRNQSAFSHKKPTRKEKRAAMLSPDEITAGRTCNCSKSRCLKKYCECFFTKKLCSNACHCLNCENYEGSIKRKETIENKEKEKQKALERQKIKKRNILKALRGKECKERSGKTDAQEKANLPG